MARVTITTSPAETLPAIGVMEIVFPDTSLPFVPRFWITHTVPPPYVSAGQAALEPVQDSAVSQGVAEARHTVVEGRNVSVGHEVLDPVQLSVMSQGPAAARQRVPAFPAGCVHVALVPLQMSRVQTLLSLVQAVPFVLKRSVGQIVLAPVHSSSRSHSPAAARQTAPAFPAGC